MMRGRNGMDRLNRALLALAAIVLALQFIFTFVSGRSGMMYGMSIGLVVVAAFRFFSRNLMRRGSENMMYTQLTESFKQRLAYRKAARGQAPAANNPFHGGPNNSERKRRTKIVTCKTCGQKLRIPKGKGKIRVHCAKCGNAFELKS